MILFVQRPDGWTYPNGWFDNGTKHVHYTVFLNDLNGAPRPTPKS